MLNLLFWMFFYTLALALSQVLLRLGASQIGGFSVKGLGDLFLLSFSALKNPILVLGTTLMASSFFLWLYILSWYRLAVAFPLTALTFVFVAVMSHLLLGERLAAFNYLGILLIAVGIFFLLYKAS